MPLELEILILEAAYIVCFDLIFLGEITMVFKLVAVFSSLVFIVQLRFYFTIPQCRCGCRALKKCVVLNPQKAVRVGAQVY